ncbi:MAG: sulfotransferase [Cyanobacteria bacterium P01_A01_bin.17]
MTSLFHPLCGSNLSTLSQLLTQNGPIAPKYLPHAAFALGFTLLRWPITTTERLISAINPRPPIESPVFIVGYWRSGTTHLHNLMSQDPTFGYISPLATGLPWDILGIVRAFEPLLEKALPEDRYVDNVAVTPNSPQEDSIALASMLPLSYYHSLYFPRRFEYHFRRGVYFEDCSEQEIELWKQRHVQFLSKVSVHQGGKRILMKNPVYVGHIAKLRAIWPQAKFVHIYRNPYTVFQSTRHFFTKLLPELTLQTHDELPIDQLILESYPQLMGALEVDSGQLPNDSFVEIRFEDLECDPMGQLAKIYNTLNLPNYEQAQPHFKDYLQKLGTYQKNSYPPNVEDRAKVDRLWKPFIQKWSYV